MLDLGDVLRSCCLLAELACCTCVHQRLLHSDPQTGQPAGAADRAVPPAVTLPPPLPLWFLLTCPGLPHTPPEGSSAENAGKCME